MNFERHSLAEVLRKSGFDLSLGAGFFGFYAHLGFVKALEEHRLIPKKIYGSSAGAIIGAFWATGRTSEEIEEILLNIQRSHFWDPGVGAGLLRGIKYREILKQYLPESFEALKIPVEISVFNLGRLRTQIMQTGNLRDAVRASSAFPGLFQPVKIGNSYFVDGGLGDELALGGRETNETLLVHAFGEKPAMRASEKKLEKQRGKKIVLNLKEIPSCGPHLMHLGHEIIERAYIQTRELLNLPPGLPRLNE